MSEETTQSPAPSGSGLDRRKVLRASAWAAPVVLVATATPAAAASPTVVERGVLQFNNFTIDGVKQKATAGTSSHKAEIRGNFGMKYAFNDWGSGVGSPPTTITVTYTLKVDGNVVNAASGSTNIAQWGSSTGVQWSVTGLSAGVHTVEFIATVTPVVNGDYKYVVTPLERTVSVTVNV